MLSAIRYANKQIGMDHMPSKINVCAQPVKSHLSPKAWESCAVSALAKINILRNKMMKWEDEWRLRLAVLLCLLLCCSDNPFSLASLSDVKEKTCQVLSDASCIKQNAAGDTIAWSPLNGLH